MTDLLTELRRVVEASLRDIEMLLDELADNQRIIVEHANRIEMLQTATDERAEVIVVLDRALKEAQEVARDSVANVHYQEVRTERDELLESRSHAESAIQAFDGERATLLEARQQLEEQLSASRQETQALRAELQPLYEALDGRASVIAELKSACDERLAVIERMAADREASPQSDGVDWRTLAEERAVALDLLSREAEKRSVLLSEVTAALQARTREVEDARGRRGRT